jgi:elongation factor 1-beta
MSKVAIVYSILPSTPEVNISELRTEIRDSIPEGVEFRGTAVKPVAFGLNAIHLMVIVDDRKGEAEKVEKSLKNLKNVQSVDTVEVSLL